MLFITDLFNIKKTEKVALNINPFGEKEAHITILVPILSFPFSSDFGTHMITISF